MREVTLARWDAADLARRIGATIEGDAGAPVSTVTTDSRTAQGGDVFFALDGARVRGREFVSDAFGSGCSVAVVDNEGAAHVPAGRAVLRVADPLAALGRFAESVRREWNCPVIAITGSAGKTSAKEMTAHVLEATGPVFKSPGNFNTVEGLSRAILALTEAPRIAVVEAGASKPGEIARLAQIARPTSAAITLIGAAHLEGFGTLADVAREKGDLVRAVERNGLAVLNGDDPYLLDLAAKLACRVVRVGFGPACDWRVVRRETTPKGGSRFRLANGVEGVVPVPGEHQVRNALTALALASEHGVPLHVGIERLASFSGVPGRLVIREHGGVLVADDTYNANPASMAAALAWFTEVRAPGRRAVALGDMLELGAASPHFHRELGKQIAELAPDFALFVGRESRAAFEEAAERTGDKSSIRYAEDSDMAARILVEWVRPGDTVLVKGSRGVRMERVVRALVPEGEAPHAL